MNDIKQWFIERQAIYSILALLYRGELEPGLDLLTSTEILQKFAAFNENKELSLGAKEAIADIENHSNNSEYKELLYEDYQNLFIGPDRLLAPPWESVYLSKDKLIFGEPELVVRKLYKSFGLEVTSAEPADHIAFELSFMSRLCDMAIKNNCDDALDNLANQQSFLKDHLLKWVSLFTDDVRTKSQTKFWKGFALLTTGWLLNDLIEIEKVLDVN